MITAELANGYNKDVFAVPGKITDSKSAGCNYLIRSSKAYLLSSANDLLETMGWSEKSLKRKQITGQAESIIHCGVITRKSGW